MKQKKYHKAPFSFVAGMAAMALLTALVSSAAASSGSVAYNRIGLTLFGKEEITIGDNYAAPNGQQVPSSITYTDAAGGKTNYLSVRQIAELFNAKIAWNSAAGTVDVAPPRIGAPAAEILDGAVVIPGDSSSFIVTEGGAESEPYSVEPEYGKVIGPIEEVDPAKIADRITFDPNNPKIEAPHVGLQETRVQYQFFAFPEYVYNVAGWGEYVVFTVTNNGTFDQYVTVDRQIVISQGERDSFSRVLVRPGDTLVRAFHVQPGADYLDCQMVFGVDSGGVFERDSYTDVTVTLEMYA